MNANENTCLGCAALGHLEYMRTLAPDLVAGLKNDHQFAQHARQLDMFLMGSAEGEEELAKATATIPKGAVEYEAAKAGLNEAMHKVERGIDPEFQRFAREILVEQAANKPFITSDDIWARMPERFDRDHYREPRHMSAIIKWGVKQRRIEKNNRYVPSKSPKGNMGPHNQWRSLIFEGIHHGD